MPRKRQTSAEQHPRTPQPRPTFLLDLPLQVTPGQAKRLRAHLEAARQFSNAILSEGHQRLRRRRADPAWQAARARPGTQPQERARACAPLRRQQGFWEDARHDAAQGRNCPWIAAHLDAVLAQTLATRASRALTRGGLGQARRGRFTSRGRGLCSGENHRADTGWRFLLQRPEAGHAG
jgi:hypothetical protein